MADRRKAVKAPPAKLARRKPAAPTKAYTSSVDEEEVDSFRGLLRATGTPGVFINKMGVLVDERGVALTLSQLRKADDERFSAILGEKIDSPVKFMKAVTLDPRTPLPLRLDAAKAVAPYTDRKMPTAIEGPTPGSPVAVEINMREALHLDMDEASLQEMMKIMAKAEAKRTTGKT